MGPQAAGKHRQIVTFGRSSDDHVAVRQDIEIADAVGRQFQLGGRRGPVVDFRDPIERKRPLDDVAQDNTVGQMDCDRRAKRPVVSNIGVGDRADHPYPAAERLGQQRLEIDHVRLAGRIVLGIHAVIGGRTNDGSEVQQTTNFAIDRLIKVERCGLFGRVFVLHVVGERQVKEVRLAVLDQGGAGAEYEQARLTAIDLSGVT